MLPDGGSTPPFSTNTYFSGGAYGPRRESKALKYGPFLCLTGTYGSPGVSLGSTGDRGVQVGYSARERVPTWLCTPTMPLTDVACRQAKPTATRRKLHDANGLYLEVMPAGRRLWRMRYRLGTLARLAAHMPAPDAAPVTETRADGPHRLALDLRHGSRFAPLLAEPRGSLDCLTDRPVRNAAGDVAERFSF